MGIEAETGVVVTVTVTGPPLIGFFCFALSVWRAARVPARLATAAVFCSAVSGVLPVPRQSRALHAKKGFPLNVNRGRFMRKGLPLQRQSLGAAPARWELPVALDADEVLVTPRLSALARLQDFRAEVGLAGKIE